MAGHEGGTMGAEEVGEGLIRTGNSLIGIGWAITRGFFSLVFGMLVLGLLIGGCVALFG
jgi:hypothetical protein